MKNFQTKFASILAVIAAAAISATVPGAPAQASNCANDQYMHNGSRMDVYWCDEGLNIAYDSPRSALYKHGVQQGTILFEGSATSNGLLSGSAMVFKRGCGSLSFPVTGRQHGDTIVLRGRAPVRRSDCSVKRYRSDKMIFTLIAG